MERHLDTQLLIIGGGAAGTVAAITAAESGVKDILVLEKSGVLGGAGNAAQGMYAVNSPLQRRENVVISAEREFQDIMYSTCYLANGPLLKLFLDNSGRTVEWLMAHDLDIILSPEVQQFGHYLSGRVFHRWNHLPDRFAHLRNIMEKSGVKLLPKCKVTELICSMSGAVTGARATDKDGNTLFVSAQAVLITTGGYVGNDKMVAEALSDVLDYEPLHFISNSTGDGLQMAWNAGAAKASERSMVCHGVMPGDTFPPRFTHTDQAIMNIPILWVNRCGERFANEEILFDSQFFGNACLTQGGIAYAVFDQAALEEWKVKTIPYEMNIWDRLGENGTHFPAAVTNFDSEFAYLQKTNSGYMADTAEGLADMLGWERETFKSTLAVYNHACDIKRDDLFFKNPRYLRYPVRTGPFYALRGKSIIMATVGGVRVDTALRALTPDYRIIPNLYIAGADAGGIYHGHSYLPKEGFALGWALTTGMIAGENIASVLKNNIRNK